MNEEYIDRIEKELDDARSALQSGNDGRARVCLRRAAGVAIAWYLTKFPKPAWRRDAMSMLAALGDDTSIPEDVRNAASRLTAKISPQFNYPSTNDPLADAQTIILFVRNSVERHD